MNKRGRKSIDGKRRDIRVPVRLSEADAAILDAARGELSRNEYIIRVIRFGAGRYLEIRRAHLTTQEILRGCPSAHIGSVEP